MFTFFALYVVMLFVITGLTSRKTDKMSYFTGNRKSPWFVVAYGMIGSSLSGVTFMSVPGDVYTTQFTYLGVVFGYILGYIVIGLLLLPLYYRLNVTSIYEYLGKRIGNEAHKTGALFFFLSRLLGSALRMYLVIFVLQIFVFDGWNIPIWATAIVMIAIILLYTFRGGIKTVVWTDMLQTTFLIGALIITIVVIMRNMGGSFSDIWAQMATVGKDGTDCRTVFNTDWRNNSYFLKQVIGGMFITISMTGLDQDMMQKNLSCRSLRESQRNMFSFTCILVVVNILFLLLGGMLLVFAQHNGVDVSQFPTDRIYPEIAFNYLGKVGALVFVFGLISAGFSSADGTFTALTTTVCYDLLDIEKRFPTEKQQINVRRIVHLVISTLFLTVILIVSQPPQRCAHPHHLHGGFLHLRPDSGSFRLRHVHQARDPAVAPLARTGHRHRHSGLLLHPRHALPAVALRLQVRLRTADCQRVAGVRGVGCGEPESINIMNVRESMNMNR